MRGWARSRADTRPQSGGEVPISCTACARRSLSRSESLARADGWRTCGEGIMGFMLANAEVDGEKGED